MAFLIRIHMGHHHYVRRYRLGLTVTNRPAHIDGWMDGRTDATRTKGYNILSKAGHSIALNLIHPVFFPLIWAHLMFAHYTPQVSQGNIVPLVLLPSRHSG
jgi:hypothetical protein